MILDEPASGMDPLSRRGIYDWLCADWRKPAATVFISSHILSETRGDVFLDLRDESRPIAASGRG